MTADTPDTIATISLHRATAASLRRQADEITDDDNQRAYLETAALAYETIARQMELSRARANQINQLALRLQVAHLKKS